MLYTILQIVAFQALFLLVYDLFLRRETFFNYNRAYLLITTLLSLVLPFLKFPELKKMATKDVVIQLPEVFIGTATPTEQDIFIAEQAGIIMEQPQIPLWQTIAIIGIVVASLIFVSKIVKLFWIKHSSPKRWKGNVLIVKLIRSSAAFSFFNTIFLGEQIPENDKPTIYKHELVHIREWHTLDLLLFEILRIIFWFNPLVYIYQNRIKELHEFIADAKAVKNGKAAYYQSLLNQVFDIQNVSFTNTFFKTSLIKKRIAMLQKSKSKQRHLIKYALLIPLVFGMLIYTSMEVKAQEKIETNSEVTSQQMTDEELIEKYYQEMLKMERDGKAFFEIAEFAGFKGETGEKYIVSREQYLKSRAYIRYIAESNISRKSQKGTLTQHDIERAEELKSIGYKTYEEYREWKKSDEAKDQWMANAKDGQLRYVVNSIDKMTEKEQQYFDALVTQLGSDPKFDRLLLCEVTGGSKLELTDPIGSNTRRVEENVEVPFSVVEEVPTTVKCKDLLSNEERKRCMSAFVTKHVNKNFNKSIADSLKLTGKQRIFVSFKIDKEGHVTDVRSRAKHVALEEEAKRVINTLPQFIPGRQKGKHVVVPYSLPIVFQTSNTPNYDQFADSLNNKLELKLKELNEMTERLRKNSSEENPLVVKLNRQIDSLKNLLTKEEKEALLKKLIENREVEEIKKAIEKSKEDDIVPYSVVEVAPAHPNCKSISDEKERKYCTSAEVQKMVNSNFNKDLAATLDLPDGQQKIFGAFTIDKQGFVTDAKARAPHKKLEEEFVRVINLLPQFIPGETKGKKVNVPYSLPIVFQIVNDKKKKD